MKWFWKTSTKNTETVIKKREEEKHVDALRLMLQQRREEMLKEALRVSTEGRKDG